MSSVTSRAGLRKPDTIDNVNVVTDLNNNWDTLDLNMNFRSCTSSTRPSTLWDGLCIHETDTNRQYVWNSTPATSGWYELYGSGGTITQVNLSGATTGAMTLTNNVTGDTNKRLQVRADGRVELGSGSGATDTFVRRLASNSLITDGALTVAGTTTVQSTTDSTALNVSGGGTFAKSLTVGGPASLGGAQGVLALKDATTPPGSAPNNGVLIYSQSSQPQYTNAQNNTYLISGAQAGIAVSSLSGTVTETTLISIVIPANEVVQEGFYRLHAFGNLSTPATASSVTFKTKQNGTTMLSSGALSTAAAIMTGKQWMLDTYFRFRSPGASCNIYNQLVTMDRFENTVTPNANRVVHDSHSAGATLNSTSAITIAITAQLGSANASYVLTTMGYTFERVV